MTLVTDAETLFALYQNRLHRYLSRASGETELARKSQPLSLRGLYHRPMPFYFDSIAAGAIALDIFGEVTAAPAERTSDVKIMTRSRIVDPNQPAGRPFPRETIATIRITPDEVVSVQLPQVSDSPPFASRALSLKIRLRQLR